jgi:hypothetical protein
MAECLNKKIVAVTLLVLMSLGLAITPLIIVLGQSTMGVSILQVVPASKANIYVAGESQYNGTAGTAMNLQGTLYTSNGTFNVIVGNDLVASGTSNGYYVNVNFTVPQLPGGGYNLILEDVEAHDLNSTGQTPETFTILTAYTVVPVPTYIQEGNSLTLDIGVEGGSANHAYAANVTVTLPSPLTETYSTMVSLGTSNQYGTASSQVTFPGSFQSSGSGVANATEYAGSYTAYFNQTEGLGSGAFSVGFLDSATYHRGDTATVKAIGYAPSQTATLTVTGSSGASLFTNPLPTLTASSDGVIATTFPIPSTAAVGKYNVTITTNSGTPKTVLDKQQFSITGYPVKIITVNLAGEVVPNIVVKVQDSASSSTYSGTSQYNGEADFNLEAGTYNLTATWNGFTVGQTSITVTGAGSFNLPCKLTNLVIVVQNENGTALPFVNLEITYKYGSSQIGNASGQTGPTGTFTLDSTWIGATYTIQASVYNQVFNSGNETVSSLPAQASSTVVIICPTETLTVNVVGYTNAPISGARMEFVELTSGLFYTASTDSAGSVTMPVTFGEYRLQIYQNAILLNETTLQVFSNSQYNIRCTLYGIQVSVSVVDYFGQPISNANVTVNGPSSERLSAMTLGDGTATFNNVIGGNMQIVAFPPGARSSYQALSMTVDKPTSVQIKMDGYIAFGSLLIPTTAMFTFIIALVAVILLVTVEIYRRRKHRAAAT